MHGRVVFDPAPAAADPVAFGEELAHGLERLGARTTRGTGGVHFHVPLSKLTTDSPLGLASTGQISLSEHEGSLVVSYALNQWTMCLAFGVVLFGMTGLFLYLDDALPKHYTLLALGLGFAFPALASALLTGLEFREFLRACMAQSLCASQASWPARGCALSRVRWAKDEPVLAWVPRWIRPVLTLELLPVVVCCAAVGALMRTMVGDIPDGVVILFGVGSAFVCGLRFFLVRGKAGQVRRALGRTLARTRARLVAVSVADLAELAAVEDGTAVRCCGRVRTRSTLPGLFVGTPAVYRFVSVVFRIARRHRGRVELHVVHEAGDAFDLIDVRGTAIPVNLAGAQVLTPSAHQRPLSLAQMARILALAIPEMVTGTVTGGMIASEWLLRDGQEVEVVAQKRGSGLVSAEKRPLLIVPQS